MSLTLATLTEKVRRRLLDQNKKLSDTIDADIESVVDQAFHALARAVASHPDPRYRGYAQTEFPFTMTSGVADLSTEPTLMIEYVLRVTHATHGVMNHAVDLTYLGAQKNELARAWYAIEQDKLYGRMDDGETDPDDDEVTVLASYVPSLSTLHAQLEDDLVSTVAAMVEGPATAADQG